jgi:hypothetical protein
MLLLNNNLEIWGMDAFHIKKLQDKEQFKLITKKLQEHGIKLNEDKAFDVGDSESLL